MSISRIFDILEHHKEIYEDFTAPVLLPDLQFPVCVLRYHVQLSEDGEGFTVQIQWTNRCTGSVKRRSIKVQQSDDLRTFEKVMETTLQENITEYHVSKNKHMKMVIYTAKEQCAVFNLKPWISE